MTFVDQLSIAALVAAIIGIGITVYFGRKALRPVRRKLRWNFVAEPLFPQGSQDFRDAIEVRVLGRPIHDPHLSTLTLANVGRDDISSDLFDRGRPVEFEVAGKVATLQPLTFPENATVAGRYVRFGPNLLRAGHSWTVRIVTEGRARAILSSEYLVGTSFSESDASILRVEKAQAATALRISAISALGAMTAALVAGILSIL